MKPFFSLRLQLLVVAAITLFAVRAFAQIEMAEMVLEFIKDPSNDNETRGLFLDQIRSEVKGADATKLFAESIPSLSKDAQAQMISALGVRGDFVAKPAIIKAMGSEDESVRVAAIRAIAKLGDTSDCETLIAGLAKPGAEMKAAKTSLIQIQGDGITQAIADQISKAASETKVQLIDILASRRALDTIPTMLEVAVGDDGKVRAAAMKALSSIASAEHIPGMVQGVLKADKSQRANAERAVAAVCNRIDDVEKRAEPLIAAFDKLDSEQQRTMLVTLGRVGGSASLERVEKALASKDSAMHYAGLAALANWPNASVASKLEELAYKDPSVKNQRTALRALIRVCPMNDGRTDEEKLRLLKRAMDMSVRVDDRRYCLQRAGAIRILDSLHWLLPFVDDPRYAEQACTSICELAHITPLRRGHEAEFHAALDKVIAVSKDEVSIDRANRYKKNQTWERPK